MTTEPNPSQSTPLNTPSIPQYSVNEYARYATTVKKNNEWVIEYLQTQLLNTQKQLTDKEKKLEDKVLMLHEKNIDLQLAKQEISQLKDNSIIQFGLGLVSTLLIGFGINLATSNPPVEAGKWMVVSAIIIQIISFASTLLARFRKNKP